jgi:hypothetical protein
MLVLFIGRKLNMIKETESLLNASKKVGLEIKAETSKHMFMSR